MAVHARRHVTSGAADHVISASASGSGVGGAGSRRRTSTREKIARMVAEGATNYPSYLKLIYTGDSEEPSSSEDELAVPGRTRERTTSASGSGARGEGRSGSGDVLHSGDTVPILDCRFRRQTGANTTLQSSSDGSNNCQCRLDSMSFITNYLVIDFVVIVVVVKRHNEV